MTANLHPLPREATGTRVIPMRRTIYTEARKIYTEARKIALSAGNDWPRLLGAAQTLSQSPDWTDAALARHIRDAYSLHLAGLLKPVDPAHRDRCVAIAVRHWEGEPEDTIAMAAEIRKGDTP